MAVDQDRILRLIVAGLNFRDAYERLCQRLQTLEAQCTAPNADLPLIQQQLTSILIKAANPFNTVIRDTTHLQREYEHFQRNYRQNQNHKRAMERKRRAKGIAPRPKPVPVQTLLDYTSPNYILSPPPNTRYATPPHNDPSPAVIPDFQTIPTPPSGGSDNSPPLPPGVPPMPPDTDPDGQYEWWEKHGQYLPND